DLPCMDDDDLRRGKPTNHKVYGETLAVLAGDALQPEAYRLILTAPGLDESRRAACGRILAEASGADGMVAGQVLDTLHAPRSEAEVTEVHRLKTGAMIAGACRLGVAAAGGGEDLMSAAGTYARELGLAFQIRDDMLDVCGDAAEFGKPIGSDQEEGKVTFVDLLGLEGCGRAVHARTEAAKAAVAACDRDGFLSALADALAERNK
ncbi:MAG TPA: polyprenyl synthetase family protein, partial [Candidatus Oscillibacter excrementavium]|nr:polyprenyl synthetase family protein [Candidatus Oscillibacter excrementavium]